MPFIGIKPVILKTVGSAQIGKCADISVISKYRSKGKFSRKKLGQTLIAFAMESMLPGAMKKIMSNQKLRPQELAGLGAAFGVGAMLGDAAGAAGNLQGLWGFVAGNARDEFINIAGSLSGGVQDLGTRLRSLPSASVSTQNIEAVRAASALVTAGASAQNSGIKAALNRTCLTFGGESQKIFEAYDAALVLRNLAMNLETSANAASRVFSSAGNAMATVNQLATAGINQQLTDTGLKGLQQDIDQIRSIANLPDSAFNMCGPDAFRTMSIMRQACTAVDGFMSADGFAGFDWENLTRDYVDAMLSSEIGALADKAAGFTSFSGSDLVNGITETTDNFLSNALCSGGSDNLADGFASEFGQKVGEGIAAVSAVATLYSTGKEMTQTFKTALGAMQSVGAGGAINDMIGGNMNGLFGLASGQVSSAQLSALRELRECLGKEAGADPQALAIVNSEIQKAESTSNNRWGMVLGTFDANGYFDKAKTLRDAKDKTNTSIANGTAITLQTASAG